MSHQLQPAPLIFGNRQVSTSTARRYLNPGQATGNAGTNAVGLDVLSRGRKIRRMRLRIRRGRGTGEVITYIARINGVDHPDLRIAKASTWQGVETLVLPIEKVVLLPPDPFIQLAVDKAASVGQSPLDISVNLELL